MKRKPPEGGGRKGGTLFPRLNLEAAVQCAKRLVSKTHGGSQPEAVILAGVVQASSSRGKIKLSALKQFGFLEGNKQGYEASDLARSVAVAPPEELSALLQQAVLRPPIFKFLFDTFQSDTVSIARIKQAASGKKVHLDSLDSCAAIFIESVEFAGLGTRDGEGLKLKASPALPNGAAPRLEAEGDPPGDGADSVPLADGAPAAAAPPNGAAVLDGFNGAPEAPRKGPGAFQVSINIDPTMDPEKLEKHLKILRTYGIC